MFTWYTIIYDFNNSYLIFVILNWSIRSINEIRIGLPICVKVDLGVIAKKSSRNWIFAIGRSFVSCSRQNWLRCYSWKMNYRDKWISLSSHIGNHSFITSGNPIYTLGFTEHSIPTSTAGGSYFPDSVNTWWPVPGVLDQTYYVTTTHWKRDWTL